MYSSTSRRSDAFGEAGKARARSSSRPVPLFMNCFCGRRLRVAEKVLVDQRG